MTGYDDHDLDLDCLMIININYPELTMNGDYL